MFDKAGNSYRWITGLWVAASILLPLGGFAQEKVKPVYQSEIITVRTKGHATRVEAGIEKARDLYLVATDAGDGFSFDHCDWANPKLIGAGKTVRLTDLEWQSARSGYGEVRKNRNCVGGPLRIQDRDQEFGIGTHANSIIHFRLPEKHEFTKLVATAGIDNSGSDQGGGDQASVQFLVFTEKPPAKFFAATPNRRTSTDHRLDRVLSQFEVHPEIRLQLFAAEPQLVNPTNIDIDHRGRVWVAEVVNYRGKRNTRQAGDRILILTDEDGDAKADRQTVFYQGRDIDSVHGICVLGNRLLVSAGSQVFFLIDENHDLKADRKEILFTGISGAQHDHGIHAFVFGPDGKLYFNFGNAGNQIRDRDGKPIVDIAGQTVDHRSWPYRQGMVFRCNLDGSEFETLAWNFRNNWEVCIDSIGRMWQSDNDDDGNRGVRINFVMPFGNYGYLDEITGAGWRTPRTGMAEEIPKRHWHLNDPGVVPNLLQTGAGSPTGILFYEGKSLPESFRNQLIHCDAGPNIVRAYAVQKKGFGYQAETINLMDGSRHNRWFRPSDVCVAPDGSIIVADWYDPGVGGHGMGDISHGRLFRLTGKKADASFRSPKVDLTSIDGAAQALESPNLATRFLAWRRLHESGIRSLPALCRLLENENEYLASRALWLISKLEIPVARKTKLLESAIVSQRPLLQETAIKAILQLGDGSVKESLARTIYSIDPASLPPAVLREILIGFSFRNQHPLKPESQWLAKTVGRMDSDRWAIEALGIALEGRPKSDTNGWDQHLDDLLRVASPDLKRQLVWRSRANHTMKKLAQLIAEPNTTADQCLAYFRAIDFQKQERIQPELRKLAFQTRYSTEKKRETVLKECFQRLKNLELGQTEREAIIKFIDESPNGDRTRVDMVQKFRIRQRYLWLAKLAGQPASPVRVEAASVLLDLNQSELLRQQLDQPDEERFHAILTSISANARNAAVKLLSVYALDQSKPIERRKLAARRMGDLYGGCKELVVWAKQGDLEPALEPAVRAALHHARWRDIVKEAEKIFPLTETRSEEKLPSIRQLVRRKGNPSLGMAVYQKEGTCATCHQVGGKGKKVGPDLSEIGDKLSRSAMFESILFPSAAISHNYEMHRVLTLEGEMIDGVIESESEDRLVLVDAKGNQQRILKRDIDERAKQSVSLMPDNLHQSMSEQQLVDLVEYLTRLRKKK